MYTSLHVYVYVHKCGQYIVFIYRHIRVCVYQCVGAGAAKCVSKTATHRR